jgi:Tol biopolymer transport system component
MKKYYLLVSCLSIMIIMLSSCTLVKNDEKLIAYLSGEKWMGGKIHLMNTDGSSPIMFNTGLVDDGCPIWSPDGQKLLFISADGSYNGLKRELNLYTINKDSTELTQLTYGPGDVYSAAWSPDGSRIVLAAGQDRGHIPVSLYVMNSDGSNVRQITFPDKSSSDRDPAWSPDGKAIVFSSNPQNDNREENPNYSLFILDLITNNVQRLTDENQIEWQQYLGANWSPDGKELVFYIGDTWSGTPYKIHTMDISNKKTVKISKSESAWEVTPRWSPDGQYIVFSSNRDYVNTDQTVGFDIYVMNASGSNVIRLTTSGNNFCPDWQP